MDKLLKPSLNWLLVFLPIAWVLGHSSEERHTLTFFAAALAVIPLAGWLGRATEHLAERTTEGVGGLLNATFGNAAEFIIAILAMRRGLTDVVKASITGSILGNLLLILGASFLWGGMKHPTQRFNSTAARVQATGLTLAAVALILPALFHHLSGGRRVGVEGTLSLEISVVLIVTYALMLWFSLKTHRQLFTGTAAEAAKVHDLEHAPWSLRKAVGVLIGAAALIALASELLVASVEGAAETLGMSELFVGVIVVAIVGNAAEHSSAILMARRNRMDLTIGIAVGSSTQIALFVAPVLVFLSYWLAPEPMNLVFSPAEVIAVAVGVLIAEQITGDGESNWIEGVQLLGVYVILGLLFYFL